MIFLVARVKIRIGRGRMQSDVKPSTWSLGEVSPLIQQIAKNGAAMCIAALCTAFVFDYTFWLIVDPRMLSYFVLADHIQTAVHIFGLVSVILGTSWILTLVFVYAGFAVTRSDQFWKVAIALFLFVLCLIGLGIATTGFNPVNLFDRATVFVMSVGLFVMIVLGILFHRSEASEGEGGPRHRPLTVRRAFWAVVPLFLILTMAEAMIRAWSTWDTAPTTHDVVRLEHDSTLTGNVIRLVDRGVILRDQKDGRVVFVPKGQIRRIDHRVPLKSEL
jgi:hypothetical protein